ncbi:MAG: orotidine-5'-phosphate decarboxylase [Holophagales bacterium]|jgi:orotidine-5'-phosphate decarboxylase|nr:orotidine-5'-phosphate decarboxylase [Holophagales bacterium]
MAFSFQPERDLMPDLMPPADRLAVALDVPSADRAVELAECLSGKVGVLKVGLELFCAEGPNIVRELQKFAPVFLDLKLHDIPTTVVRALNAVLGLNPLLINVHALGGLDMMKEASELVRKHRQNGGRTHLLAVTILTSMDKRALEQLNLTGEPSEMVLRLAHLAKRAGCDGVVCSAQESASLRAECGSEFLLLTPGIRPRGAETQDQVRVVTPYEAIKSGSNWIVVGRPITHAQDPATAAEAIILEMTGAGNHNGSI